MVVEFMYDPIYHLCILLLLWLFFIIVSIEETNGDMFDGEYIEGDTTKNWLVQITLMTVVVFIFGELVFWCIWYLYKH